MDNMTQIGMYNITYFNFFQVDSGYFKFEFRSI